MPWFDERDVEEIGLFEISQAITDNFDDNRLKLPLYQRDAVWSEGRVCALWDSLLRGFPLPSFLLARGNNGRNFENGNGVRGMAVEVGHLPYFVLLDGQQRVAAILAGILGNSSTRLWVDLAPPDGEIHPRLFKYWLHPCTRIFPFGFHMKASGEHDFEALSDATLRKIWRHLQHIAEFAGNDYYQLPLDRTFPWEAKCPVPLSDLLELSRADNFPDNFQEGVQALIQESAQVMRPFGERDEREPANPNPEVLEVLSNGLSRVNNAKLVLQLLDLEAIEQNQEENGGYMLFERIGRGGVQITARQLAVSKLILELGQPGNDALASFQHSKYGQLIETEEIIHAIARVALAEIRPAGQPDQNADDWEILDLSAERLHRMQTRTPDIWIGFLETLQSYCQVVGHNETRLSRAITAVFKLLEFDPVNNPNGFSLIQLAHSSRSGESIAPLTLHPLLLWQLKFSQGNPPIQEQRDNMLRWILFVNGFTTDRQNKELNRKAFNTVDQEGNFYDMLPLVFGDGDDHRKLREKLGFQWTEPRLNADGTVVDVNQDHPALPTPQIMMSRSAKRLILKNLADSSITSFVLMWNQREGLHAMYGETDEQYIPALFGKGRPYDDDHIVARSCLIRKQIPEAALQQGCSVFFNNANHADLYFVREWCFRLNLPNMKGNYRYWPKVLNRADQSDRVAKKMNIGTIVEHLQQHPLAGCFQANPDPTTPWIWSAISDNQHDWEQLPPENNIWTADSVARFIRCVLRREHLLYGNAYHFLTGQNVHPVVFQGIIG